MNSLVSFTILLAIFVTGLNGQVIGDGPCPVKSVVDNFNIESYSGTWYEIQRYPGQGPQFGLDCVASEYYLTDDSNIDVLYSGKDLDSLEWMFSDGVLVVAFPDAEQIVGRLNVSFTGNPDTNNYNVIATDYVNFSVVWGCAEFGDNQHQELAWVMARRYPLTEAERVPIDAVIEEHLNAAGFDTTLQDEAICRGETTPFD